MTNGTFSFSFVTMVNKKNLTREQALQKLKHYCSYQERCHKEVREKLYSLGVRKNEHDELIASLIEENYLNEERFALAFARGKWKMKQWGRMKIKYELKQKQISEYCIRKAIELIDDNEYAIVLKEIATQKYASLKGQQYLVRKKRTMDYLVQRGYESKLLDDVISNISGN